jgi:hypothetical protein
VDGSLLAGLDLSATTHTNVGDYPNDPWSFTDVSGNYKNVNGNVDDKISPILITITADAQTKSYGSPDPQLTFQITSGSLLYPDIFSGTLVRELGEFPGTYAIMQGTLSLPDYYVLTYVGSHLTITGVNYYLPLVLIK